jgi:hypothetical protein
VGAVCEDGWQSDSVGSGTCSHHGGVFKWKVEYWYGAKGEVVPHGWFTGVFQFSIFASVVIYQIIKLRERS